MSVHVIRIQVERPLHNRRRAIGITILVAIVAMAFPTIASLFLAREEALSERRAYVEQLVAAILRRADETTVQMYAAFAQLDGHHASNPCDDDNIALMARTGIAAEHLQGVGFVSDNQLLCSSFGPHGNSASVGPVDYISAQNFWIRTAVEFRNIPHTKFILVTDPKTGYTAIVHPHLLLDIFFDTKGISVGFMSYAAGHPIDLQGSYDPAWLSAIKSMDLMSFSDDKDVVALQRSKHGDYVAFAAIPLVDIDHHIWRSAIETVPLGIIAGLILIVAIAYIAKIQMALPAMIRGAIKRQEFFLEYQPIVDLRTGNWVGVEALVRWRRPSGDLVRPDIFIPVAEENGLIGRVSENIINLIRRDCPPLFAARSQFHIAINLSTDDVKSPRTAALLGQLVERSGARPENFIVELTERGFIDAEHARPFLNQMREMGIEVAIDDFGTGYSSLAYLQKLDVNFLKIDKSFVDTIGVEAATSHVVAHIIEMAKSLKLRMIAEGVETEQQREFLCARGVHYAQGWLFAKPMPIHELLLRIEAGADSVERPAGESAVI
jgi:sensor c-di-GMP phosphodiesterase-like protein